jgi:hypothetical protein
MPNQYSAVPKPGRRLAIGVAPGASGEGSNVDTPSSFSLPCLMYSIIVPVGIVRAIDTSPLKTAVTAGAAPL